MTFSLVLAVTLSASPVLAESASFDSGIDAKAVLTGLRATPASDVPSLDYRAMNYRWSTRDCATLSVKPGGPAASEPAWLSSTDYEQDCYWRGDPRYGGGRECYDRPARTHRERTQLVTTAPRDTYPWETETFQVCLEGLWMDARPLKTAYEYSIEEDRAEPGNFVAEPGKKIAMDPDPEGIAGTLVSSNGSLALDLSDRWASYYAHERTALKAELWLDHESWFDAKVADAEATMAPVALARLSLNAPKLEAGKKYYVKWSFTRLGSISKPTQVRKKTDAVVFQPGPGGLGR